MDEIMKNLLCDYCFSVCIHTFYQRSFNKNNLPLLSWFLVIGVITWVFGHNTVVLTSFFVAICSTFKWRHEIKFNRKFLTRIPFLLEYFNHIPRTFQFIDSPERAVLAQFLVSLIQFVRKPLSLKNRLQDIRASMGPIFVLYSVRTFDMFRSDDLAPLHPWVCFFAFANAAMALIAGVLFRPDNGYLLMELFKWRTQRPLRRSIHGCCMIISTLLACGCALVYISEYVE